MDLKQAIVATLSQSDFIVEAYLADLTDKELLARPCDGANHIAWQLGHLILSERYIVSAALGGKTEGLSPLPEGFDQKYARGTAPSDHAGDFLSKAEYVRLRKVVRTDTLRVLEKMSPADFDKPVEKVPPMIKTAGEALLLIGGHWMLHAGQWVVTRRKLGRAVMF
jgi:hypothetical protein